MKKIVSIFLATIYGMCMVACGSRSSSTEVKDNVLTEEEKAEGYTLLFNGKDFTGWKMFNGGDVKGWQVEDGVIVGYGNGGDVIADTTIKVSTDIVTVKNYHNFQIIWDLFHGSHLFSLSYVRSAQFAGYTKYAYLVLSGVWKWIWLFFGM